MPERISDELLAQAPVTHDEHARALKELVWERVLLYRRQDADMRQDAALATLAEENAKAEAPEVMPPIPALTEEMSVKIYNDGKPKPEAKAKAKKEK